jgi:hypothetical protein
MLRAIKLTLLTLTLTCSTARGLLSVIPKNTVRLKNLSGKIHETYIGRSIKYFNQER